MIPQPDPLRAVAEALHDMGLCRTPTPHTYRGHEPDAERILAVAQPIQDEPGPDARAAAGELDAAWADVVAVQPKGWVFHGVYLDDNSGSGGDWGPGWSAQMSWPGHCQYDDCDHDDAFRIGGGPTPAAALRSLLNDFSWTALPEPYKDRSYVLRATPARLGAADGERDDG